MVRDYDDTSEDEQLPDDEASTSIRSATAVTIHTATPVPDATAPGDTASIDTPKTSKTKKQAKKGKTSKLEEAVHSMVERIKTSDAMDKQLATLLGQMSSQTTDPWDTWINWMASEMWRVQPQHWREFQMASLEFIRYWTPQPDQPRQQSAQQQPPPFQPAMQPAMQPPMQPAMQPPMQPASQQPMQDSFSNINLSLDSSMFQGSSTPDISQLDTSRWLSTPHPTADIIHDANVVVQGQSTSQPATQSNKDILNLLEISSMCSKVTQVATGEVVFSTDAGAGAGDNSDSDSSEH